MDDLLRSQLMNELSMLDSALTELRRAASAFDEARGVLRAKQGLGWRGAAARAARRRAYLARTRIFRGGESCRALTVAVQQRRNEVEARLYSGQWAVTP